MILAAVAALTLTVPSTAFGSTSKTPALDAVNRQISLTHAENRSDNRPLVPYHNGAQMCAKPAAGCRWHMAMLWHKKYLHAVHQKPRYPWPSWWYGQALCVHGGEGSWTANTGNGYYGGMQFDVGTWLGNGGGVYAPTANLATPTEQLVVTYHTYQRRGWYPWPNTAHACGLI